MRGIILKYDRKVGLYPVESYFDRYVVSGGVMMFFLIPCSFFAVWFIFQGIINLRRSRIVPQSLVNSAEKMNTPGELKNFCTLVQKDRSTLAGILRRLLELNPSPGDEEMEDSSAEFIDDEISRLFHKNNQLAVIYAISPLLGLQGTILGMMKTFYIFSMAEEHSISQLSLGINEALVTTMWGLFIAIPSFFFLYIFKQKLFYYEMTLLPQAVKKVWRQVLRFQYSLPDARDNGENEKTE
jgi:biopolymer transport protein ExbB